VVALLKDEARERKVSFQLPVLPLKVRIPAGPIRQVLFNVIKNAVEASPMEGLVRVSIQGEGKEISIQVADEGPGISEKIRSQVFKPFFSTKKGRQKGLGLGLSISKEIMGSLGGSIRLQNLRGKGLLCQIDLPKRKPKKENWDA
jgi:signal transduction histidine kinase